MRDITLPSIRLLVSSNREGRKDGEGCGSSPSDSARLTNPRSAPDRDAGGPVKTDLDHSV